MKTEPGRRIHETPCGGQAQCFIPLMLTLGRLRQKDYHEFKDNLGYIVESEASLSELHSEILFSKNRKESVGDKLLFFFKMPSALQDRWTPHSQLCTSNRAAS